MTQATQQNNKEDGPFYWFEMGKRMKINRDRILADIENHSAVLYTELIKLAEMQAVTLTRKNKLAFQRHKTRLEVREKNEGKRLTEADVEALVETDPKVALLVNAVELAEIAERAAQIGVETARAYGSMLALAVKVVGVPART